MVMRSNPVGACGLVCFFRAAAKIPEDEFEDVMLVIRWNIMLRNKTPSHQEWVHSDVILENEYGQRGKIHSFDKSFSHPVWWLMIGDSE